VTPDVARWLDLAARSALDKKAFQLVALDVTPLTSLADAFLICSAGNERQVAAVAEEIRVRLKREGRIPLHVEGEGRAEWVLLDYGDLVIHVFTEERRAYYQLEKLWSEAPRVPLPEDPGRTSA